MKVYSLVVIFVCCICEYTSVDIMSELKRNILHFGYGINFKHEGMLSHSFDRFYVAIKFVLPTTDNLKFLPLKFDLTCNYLNVDLSRNKILTQYIPNLKNFCKKIIPFTDFLQETN